MQLTNLVLACAALSTAAAGSVIPLRFRTPSNPTGLPPVPANHAAYRPSHKAAARSNVAGDVLLPNNFASVQADRRRAQGERRWRQL